MNPSESSNFVKRAYKNVAEEAAKHSRHTPANVLPDMHYPGMMQQPQYAIGLPGGFQYPPAGQYMQGPSPYPFHAPGMGGMPSHPYPFAGQGQTHTFVNAPDVVTRDEFNEKVSILASAAKQLQRQADQQEEHLVNSAGYNPGKRTFDASNLSSVVQLGKSTGKQITGCPDYDDDDLDAKMDEIMRDDPEMDKRSARQLAISMLSKPKNKKARAIKAPAATAGPAFDYALWGAINLKHGQGETCPELIALVTALDPNHVRASGAIKNDIVRKIQHNRQYWGYVEMMPDPITPADQASLDDFVKRKISHGFPAALDWDGTLPNP
jgi:hypothetical protein